MIATMLFCESSGTGFSLQLQYLSRKCAEMCIFETCFKDSQFTFAFYTFTNLNLIYIGAWNIGTGRSAAINVR